MGEARHDIAVFDLGSVSIDRDSRHFAGDEDAELASPGLLPASGTTSP